MSTSIDLWKQLADDGTDAMITHLHLLTMSGLLVLIGVMSAPLGRLTGPTAALGLRGGVLAASARTDAETRAAGTFIGSLVSEAFETRLDAADRQAQREAAYYALETQRSGVRVDWRNLASGHFGHIQPVRTYTNAHGQACREFLSEVSVGTARQKVTGQACRQPDGSWQLQ
jgi:surface antigen